MIEIRSSLMNTRLRMSPQVAIELWKGHVYCAVWWNPVGAPLSILQPRRWHTTILRAWLPEGQSVPQALLDDWGMILQMIVTQVLHFEDDNHVGAWLRVPPWRRSWTFGVPLELMPAITPLQTTASAFIRAHETRADIRMPKVEEVHISWN